MKRYPAGRYELVVDARTKVPVELAVTSRARRKGLLGRSGIDGALWIEPCKQVHTFAMSFAIDVAYVDRSGHVLAVRRMPRGRFGPLRLRGRAVVEAEAGAFEVWGIEEQSVLRLQPQHA